MQSLAFIKALLDTCEGGSSYITSNEATNSDVTSSDVTSSDVTTSDVTTSYITTSDVITSDVTSASCCSVTNYFANTSCSAANQVRTLELQS